MFTIVKSLGVLHCDCPLYHHISDSEEMVNIQNDFFFRLLHLSDQDGRALSEHWSGSFLDFSFSICLTRSSAG